MPLRIPAVALTVERVQFIHHYLLTCNLRSPWKNLSRHDFLRGLRMPAEGPATRSSTPQSRQFCDCFPFVLPKMKHFDPRTLDAISPTESRNQIIGLAYTFRFSTSRS